MTPRFWPQNSGLQPEGPQPENLLQAAAAELSLVTQNEAIGEVRTSVTGDQVVHAFYLVSTKIGYRYLLFRAAHRLGFPVKIFDCATEADLECANSIELEQVLKQLFEHHVTQQIVGQLRNLSRQAS